MSMDGHTNSDADSDSGSDAETSTPSNVSVVYSLSDHKNRIEQPALLEFDECGGFNPYDTASLYKKP